MQYLILPPPPPSYAPSIILVRRRRRRIVFAVWTLDGDGRMECESERVGLDFPSSFAHITAAAADRSRVVFSVKVSICACERAKERGRQGCRRAVCLAAHLQTYFLPTTESGRHAMSPATREGGKSRLNHPPKSESGTGPSRRPHRRRLPK